MELLENERCSKRVRIILELQVGLIRLDKIHAQKNPFLASGVPGKVGVD
jgi:hypothetical protein